MIPPVKNKRYLPQGRALDPAPSARDCGAEPRGTKHCDVFAQSVMPRKRGVALVSLDNKRPGNNDFRDEFV